MPRSLLKKVALLVLITCTSSSFLLSQEGTTSPSRKSLFVGFEYSNTSSHFLIGTAQNRRLAGAQLGWSYRLGRTRLLNWNYDFAFTPVLAIEDPVSTVTQTIQFINGPIDGPFTLRSGPIPSACISGNVADPNNSQQPGVVVTTQQTCGVRWTYSGGASPLGQRFNFLPGHRLQPLALANAGFLLATRNVPADHSSSFNFTFEFGAGFEWHQSGNRSWTVEYVAQHLSNRALGLNNPGLDNQIVRVKLRFDR